MIVLGIETTCDETAVAIVENGKKIFSNVVFSQIFLHEKFHGVFPEVASRTHVEKISPVCEEALEKANLSLKEVDLIAVAQGPGLLGSLLVGIHFAKGLAHALNRPIVGVNHVEAHLYASMMAQEDFLFPALGVVLSGGHTQILYIEDIGKYQLIGTTIDDAIGESFDKVATLLDLPYPGGPSIEKLAFAGDPQKYPFKAGEVKLNVYDSSYSGLKTKVLYTVKGQKATKKSPFQLKEEEKKHIAASFQRAVFEDLVKKVLLATKEYPVKAIYFGGGVTQNETLRKYFFLSGCPIPIFWPLKGMSIDNAAMIAGLGYHKFSEENLSYLEPYTRIALDQTILPKLS